ncbi:MAG TPA: sigma-54 dependent transcriptional regulator, partial [Vicinamibacterales bacterium]|nr:sigma-54 dependent transcriptional regulator [Vicinamibacterales bacterium]
DRRRGVVDLLATLSRSIDRRHDISTLRSVFEDALRRMVPIRAVQLREGSGPWLTRMGAGQAEAIALEVPGPDPDRNGLLEASFDPECGLSEWDFQTLGLAAHIGALVLEIERSRLQLARAGLWISARPPIDDGPAIVGSTAPINELRATIERVAATDFTILLEGESGVGKELVARRIHDRSRRAAGPFVAVNCAALVETLLEAELFGIEDRTATGVKGRRGKFDAADGGTLLLDEVSDLSPSAQAKLLRAIQDLAVERVGGNGAHRVDIRIIAATNRGLRELVERKLFRPDLFYRLSGVDVRVPSLRERRDDILELARHFFARHRSFRPLRLSPEAADAFIAYEWPGNVRELERVIERLVALAEGDVVELRALPQTIGGGHVDALGTSLERNHTLRVWQNRYVRLVLERCDGNKSQAARILGISNHTLKTYLRPPSGGGDEVEMPIDESADAAERAAPTLVAAGLRAPALQRV